MQELIAVALDKAPRKYQSVLTTEKRLKGTALTIDHLNEAMKDMWRAENPMLPGFFV